ncbi:MAG: SRPBCC family protein [Nitriliruptoraceae bacterium]|nr:SRPBCC family protein [Nitriliruptoraceae bacterium]
MAKQRKVSATRVIAADRQALFDIVADPSKHPVIDGSGTVTAARPDGLPERLAMDTRFGMDMKQGAAYKITNTVVEFEEGERLAWRHFSGHRWRYEFRDVEGGTEVTETFDWSTAKLKKPLEIAGFPEKNRKGMEATLVRLEQLATTGTVDGADADAA